MDVSPWLARVIGELASKGGKNTVFRDQSKESHLNTYRARKRVFYEAKSVCRDSNRIETHSISDKPDTTVIARKQDPERILLHHNSTWILVRHA